MCVCNVVSGIKGRTYIGLLGVCESRVLEEYWTYERDSKRRMDKSCIIRIFIGEISGSRGGDYEDDCLLGCCAV
jgi:hypothetical protein